MHGNNKILFSLIIIKNALLKKKPSIVMHIDKLNLDILSLCKTVGVILTYYKLNNSHIRIIFFYYQGQPIWSIKTNLSKKRISKGNKHSSLYTRNSVKGVAYISNTTKGLRLHNNMLPLYYNGHILCTFVR